jgi:hypothetical protein
MHKHLGKILGTLTCCDPLSLLHQDHLLHGFLYLEVVYSCNRVLQKGLSIPLLSLRLIKATRLIFLLTYR